MSDSSPRGCRLSYEGRVWYDNTEVMQVGAWIVKREVIRQTDVCCNNFNRNKQVVKECSCLPSIIGSICYGKEIQ